MVQLNLPALRSFLWGSKVNQALEDLNDAKTEAADVQAIAETVAQDKFNEVVAAPNDAVVEALVQDSGSATAAALNSTYVAKAGVRIALDDYAGLVTNKPTADPETWDWHPAFTQAAADAFALSEDATIVVNGVRPVSATVVVKGRVSLDTSAGLIKAMSGFASGAVVISFGTTDDPWRAAGSVLSVDCGDQRLVGIEFTRAIRCGYAALSVVNSTFIGVRAVSGYGITLPKIDVLMSMITSGRAVNADVDSVGVFVSCSDSAFGAGDIAGGSTGLQVTGSNNSFGTLHVWGVYQKAGVPQSAPMMFGVKDEGQANTYVGTIADSPSLLDYGVAASLTNGGYGFVNRLNGTQSKFIGCNVFVPNRVALAGETMPVGRLVGFLTNQGSTYIGCEVTDQTAAAFVAGTTGLFSGTNLDDCMIVGRQFSRMGGLRQVIFENKAYFEGGMEFQLTYQKANERASSFGAASMSQTRAVITITSNFEGQTNTSRIERVKSGTSAFRTGSLTGWLIAADAGYCYFDTTLVKPVWWTGTSWVDATGAAV